MMQLVSIASACSIATECSQTWTQATILAYSWKRYVAYLCLIRSRYTDKRASHTYTSSQIHSTKLNKWAQRQFWRLAMRGFNGGQNIMLWILCDYDFVLKNNFAAGCG